MKFTQPARFLINRFNKSKDPKDSIIKTKKTSLDFWGELMKNFIYPGFLGNIIYMLYTIADKWTTYNGNGCFWIKFILLLITIVFYSCDYIYLILTKDYKWYMFRFNIIFIVSLLFTFHILELDAISTVREYSQNIKWILSIYLLFMGLYLIWDVREAREDLKTYFFIVNWEFYSVVGILFTIGFIWMFPVFNASSFYAIPLIVLTVITGLFVEIDIRKFKLIHDYQEKQ
jgi:hypothetical protein